MGNGFKLLRSKTTGKTGYYPDFYATWPDLEELDPVDDTCIDCVVDLESDEVFYDELADED